MSVAWIGLLLVAPPVAADADASGPPVRLAQLVIREQLMVVRRAAPKPAPTKWKSRKGPTCIAASDIGGAAVTEPDSVDLILRGNKRVRAEFRSSCPALDFYSGFYVRPSADGRICADRDAVHARSGGQCEIRRFRSLVPAR